MPYSLCIERLLKLIHAAWCRLPRYVLVGEDKGVTAKALKKVKSFTGIIAASRLNQMCVEVEIISNSENAALLMRKATMN